MGQCLAFDTQQILNNGFDYIQIYRYHLKAIITSASRDTGHLISLYSYSLCRRISELELERCFSHWARISRSLPSKLAYSIPIQITCHRLSISRSSDVQSISMRFSLPLSVSMNQDSENTLKHQAYAPGGPGSWSNVEMCQKEPDIVQSKLLEDKRWSEITATRRSSLCTYYTLLGIPPGIDPNTGQQQAATSDTSSRSSRSKDSDERAPVDSGNTVTSFFSVDEIQASQPLCGITPIDISGQLDDVAGQEADEIGEVETISIGIGDHRSRWPLLNPVSEYQANLDAVSPECKELFLEANAQFKDDAELLEDDSVDTYWTWSQEKQQWFHEDTDCNTIVWFPKDFD
ncbi:hypothetical protein F4810DRAFT_242413 [Camillea tinctor]|nr:hypothetical protein F4810DRAFT_242413 [Camillea tinctor]